MFPMVVGLRARALLLAVAAAVGPGVSARAAAPEAASCGIAASAGCTVSWADFALSACDQVRGFAVGRQIASEVVRAVPRCEEPVRLSGSGSAFESAAVAAEVEVDGPPSHAAFLAVRGQGRWRIVDDLLPPVWMHGGHCRTRFDVRWQQPSRSGGDWMEIASERTCVEPLDSAEVAANQSGVVSRECRIMRFRLSGAEVVRLSSKDSAGRCRPAPQTGRKPPVPKGQP